ncbi:MAG: family 78 glycoside hydrolase catalytic domain [Actinomycetes bacterium]
MGRPGDGDRSVRAPQCLRVEHLDGAVLGIGRGDPRLSWTLPLGVRRQLAHQLEIDGSIGPWMDTAEHVLVGWPQPAVPSATRVEWRVRVRTDAGISPWSEAAWFETGLLSPTDWSARWIVPENAAPSDATERPAHILRRTFEPGRSLHRVRMHATAHGVYETFLNGIRVGDQELTPGFTSYWDHVDVQTYDVTDLVHPGSNEWTVVLSDGWYRGRVGNNQDRDTYGHDVAFLAELRADHDVVVTTDAEWTSTTGPIIRADLMDGQSEDHRITIGPWNAVRTRDLDTVRLTASPAPPTRRIQRLRPVSVRRLDERHQLVDLGQNINGWIRLERLAARGSKITLVHGEALDAGGDVTLDHLSFAELKVRQTDVVVAAGTLDEAFEPRHTTHGFQYVRVEDHPDPLTPDDVTGVVVHTDLRRTGWFRCSDERINRLHDMADWSFRSNACEIPTDCPQRERSGWTGDWQVFFPSASFLYDVAGFSEKWLRSLVADQLPNGCLTNMAPEPRRATQPDDAPWTGLLGSAGWGDAIVLVPWQMYTTYRDADILERTWPAMVRWMDFALGLARTRRHPRRAERRPTPAPHEEYLWDGGWQFGEWLEPGVADEPWWAADQGHVATAYLHHTSSCMASIAGLLGREDDVERYRNVAERSRDAWQQEYVADDGSLTPDTQPTHVRALRFGLVPDDLVAHTADRLAALVRGAGTHLATGFLSTADLLPALADHGHADVAFDLLFQDTSPSWLTMVDRGATTVWESWDGITADGSAHESLNHYSKGAVVSFLHTHVAGIRPITGEPAYRRFRVAPVVDNHGPAPRLRWADAVHDSPAGRIASSWALTDGVFDLTVTVPPGTVAEVELPDGSRTDQQPGTSSYSCVVVPG